MNYELVSGCFEGSVVEEGCQVLDVDFLNLDEDLRTRIMTWAENQIGRLYRRLNTERTGTLSDDVFVPICFTRSRSIDNNPLTWNEIKDDYEDDWDNVETEEKVTLKPVSEWNKD